MTPGSQEEQHDQAYDERELAPESVPLANSVSLSDSDCETDVCDQAAQAPPKVGTLAWLAQQEHIDWHGLNIPKPNRIPEGASLHPETDGRCRVVRPDGERCRAPATRTYGLCTPHAGGGGGDYVAMSKAGHAAKAKMRHSRMLLGIGANRVGSARQRARIAAAARADEIATALVDDVLDADLAPLARQQAVLRILDAVEPLQSMSVEVEMPADAAGVEALSWQDMQALAARLIDGDAVSTGVQRALHPAPLSQD
jgi:hypothetical protein